MKLTRAYTRALPFAIACAALLIGACSQAVKSAEPEPDPKPAPMIQPTLLGTWERVHDGRDDDGVIVEKETITLTFTETHYFERNHIQDTDGRTRHKWDNVGTVSRTDSTVTKSFFHDDRPFSIEKDYFLVADGDVLLIHTWGDEEQVDGFDRFTRIADASMTTGLPSSLRGTWRKSGAWYDEDEDGTWREDIETITFTESRFIMDGVKFNTDNDEILDRWTWSGGWIDHVSGDSVTRIEHDHASVVKQYVIAGDLLAINSWSDNEPTNGFDVFTRVHDPLPGGVLGAWTCEATFTRDDGRVWNFTYAFTFGESSFAEDFNRYSPDEKTFDLAGSPRYDDENNFVFVTAQQAEQTLDGSTDEGFDLTEWIGHEIRYAWAPTGRPDEIVLSGYWVEQQYDSGTQMWKEHEEHPYGAYHLRLGRRATTTCRF